MVATPCVDDNGTMGLIYATADICGFFPSSSAHGDDACPRSRVRRSVLQLSTSLLPMMKTCHEFESTPLHLLRECEEEIRNVRRDAGFFLDSMAVQRPEMLMLDDDSVEIAGLGSRNDTAWIVFCRSLISQYRRQSQREEDLVQKLQAKLDDIYAEFTASEGTENATYVLQQTALCLKREIILDQIQYREGIRLLQQLHSPSQLPQSVDGLCRQPTVLGVPSLHDDTRRSHLNVFVGPARNAWDVFQKLQESSKSEEAFACSMLIVGHEGSGKTHLCNQMERGVHSSTTGESLCRSHCVSSGWLLIQFFS